MDKDSRGGGGLDRGMSGTGLINMGMSKIKYYS